VRESANGAELAIVVFFRITDGKFVEYWEVVAPIRLTVMDPADDRRPKFHLRPGAGMRFAAGA
jgi:predicted SnoaL-like aldol condensation-catalyzing enzyme